MRDDRNLNSGMRDENRTQGQGYAPFLSWDKGRTSMGGIII